ncbi:MAG TPA: hypothetical protein DIW80_19470 [Gordonia polyisoprenivorans]|uniref:hypothetical protein n=1 Tax=uncultured Gordonia sp. TaxID=198437 RepID=UPI000EBA52DD|nr:hypothetical protein [uncultured Gordonia sp.]HCS59064.1 hypothetical protein [Gordonia polyisoprenivorans]
MTSPRHGHALDEWRATPTQLSELAGLTTAYLADDPAVSIELLRVSKTPHAAQLVLALLQLLDENHHGDREILTGRLRAAALLYAERAAQGWSNRTDGLPQHDWSDEE